VSRDRVRPRLCEYLDRDILAMDTEIFFRELAAIGTLSEELKTALENELKPLSLPKDHFLLQPPQVSDQAYFILHGFAFSYILVEGERKIEWFWKQNQLIISPLSFFEQKPAQEFIQLAEASELLCISYKSLLMLLDNFPEAHRINRIIMNKYFENSRQRIRDLHRLNAYERFRRLVAYYPSVEQMVSQEAIASYLGITPQSLSRIKRLTGRVN
jgi:CRP/FNR family transcriptional regulator, anaerobic regulatory protein